MTDLAGSHVVVVGATGVLGSAICRHLAGAGAVLTVVGRQQDKLDALAADLGAAVVATVSADLTDPGCAGRVVEGATSGGREVKGLVIASGVVAFGPLTDLDDDDVDQLFLVNFLGPLRVVRAMLEVLGRDSVVALLSAVVAERPTAGMAAYSASKAALTALDRALALELRRQGIRVLDARPPHTETGLATRPLSGNAPALGQGKDPDEVAERIVRAMVDDERDLPASAFD